MKKRKLFRKENQHFELNRRKFYRNLIEEDTIIEHSVPKEEMIKY